MVQTHTSCRNSGAACVDLEIPDADYIDDYYPSNRGTRGTSHGDNSDEISRICHFGTGTDGGWYCSRSWSVERHARCTTGCEGYCAVALTFRVLRCP